MQDNFSYFPVTSPELSQYRALGKYSTNSLNKASWHIKKTYIYIGAIPSQGPKYSCPLSLFSLSRYLRDRLRIVIDEHEKETKRN